MELTAESNSLAFETLELVRSGSLSGGGGGGGAGGDKEAEKLDVDDLRWEQLSAIADNVLHQIRRDLWMERERIGL